MRGSDESSSSSSSEDSSSDEGTPKKKLNLSKEDVERTNTIQSLLLGAAPNAVGEVFTCISLSEKS